MKRKNFVYLCVFLLYIMVHCTGCAQTADTSVDSNEQDSSDVEVVESHSEHQATDDVDIEEDAQEDNSSETETVLEETGGTEETDPGKTSDDIQDDLEISMENITEEEKTAYSYTELSAVMYAASAVNVRALPTAEGEKIGGLSAAQEVAVTGQCNETFWYRIEYNGQIGYVSNKYIVAEKPVTEAPAVAGVPETSQSTEPSGLVSISNLANKKSLKKKCTDEEFQAAYDVAVQIVTPLIGLSREDQLAGIAEALREMVDSGQVVYSTEDAHYNDPYGYLVLGVASCAGCTRTTGLCLNMLGISYEHVNENQWGHQWCRVEIEGTYWICDAYGLYVGPEPGPYAHPNVY